MNIFDEITDLFGLISDMHKTLEICSFGLETAGEIKALSIIELYRKLLDDIETRLQNILQQLEDEECN